MTDHWKLFICGARGSHPASGAEYLEFGGATSCYILKHEDYAIVVDCGSGLYQAGPILADCTNIDVLLTHLHYDHIIGLLNFSVFPQDAKLRFISNFSCWYGQDTLTRFMQPPFWPYTPDFGRLINIDPPEQMPLHCGARADFQVSSHPNDAVLVQLYAGEKRICFLCDYEHGNLSLGAWIRNCDWIIYDGTFSQEEYPSHVGWGHSSWEEGCNLARESNVAHLIISHHEPNRTDEQLRRWEKKAKTIFPRVHFAREGHHFIL